MNERVKDQQSTPRVAPVSESHHIDSHGVRVDAAHVVPGEPQLRDVVWQNLEHFQVKAPAPVPTAEPAAPLGDFDTQFLDDWGQRARKLQAQIQTQRASLDQREQALQFDLASLDEEKHRFVHRVANDQAQLDAQRAQLQKNETAHAERLITFEVQSRKFESERDAFLKQRADLDARQQRMRDEIVAEFQAEREELDRARTALHQDSEQVKTTKDVLQTRLSSLSAENELTLKGEREKLWSSLSEEWEQRNRDFQQQQSEWEKTCELEKSEIDREKAMFEAAVESANAEFLQAREALADELTARREEHARQLIEEQGQFQVELAKQAADQQLARDAFTTELQSLRQQQSEELLQQQEAWAKTRRQEEDDLLSRRDALVLEISASREQHDQTLKLERESWESTLSQEKSLWESQRVEAQLVLQDELDQLKLSCEQQRVALQAEREAWELDRQDQSTELENQRAAVAAEVEAQRIELVSLKQQHDELLATERADWDQARTQAEEAFDARQREWESSRDAQLLASREALEVEFMTLREQHAAMLRTEREDWNRTLSAEKTLLEERQAEFVRERTLIENRIRFQQDHLEKSRAELEHAQNEYRRDRQVERQRLEEAGILMIRRLKQIDLYRSSVDAREKSLDREQEVLGRTRKAITSTADFDRLNFQSERHAWEQERQIQQNEMRRQQEAMATRAEGLEGRRARLDKLRAELEETHRTTLEMRLAVEEAWAQLSQASGPDEARQRVEQVRQALAGYYQQMHESLAEQRREHVDSQSKFERQRAEFTDERQRLTTWLTTRDEELRLGEERLRIAANDAATNHAKWLTARDRWLLEKTEAEQLIRRLLASLGENNREQSGEHDSLMRLDEMNRAYDEVLSARP